MNIVVEYTDQDNKTRWGYVTAKDTQKLRIYTDTAKELQSDPHNEVLRERLKKNGDEKISVYLLDGRVGDPFLKHLRFVPPFVQYEPMPQPRNQNEQKPQ